MPSITDLIGVNEASNPMVVDNGSSYPAPVPATNAWCQGTLPLVYESPTTVTSTSAGTAYQLAGQLGASYSFSVPNPTPSPQRNRREELLALHQRLSSAALTLMRQKNMDYGSSSDPFRNFRSFGVLGILVRMGDKLDRLRNFVDNGRLEVSNEPVRDVVLDLINYAVLLQGFLEDDGA